jgi:hypothetical protein
VKTNRPVTPRQEQQHERALFAAIAAEQSVEERGLPYRDVHRQIGVSVAAIGRVARDLLSGNCRYRALTDRLKSHV